jgi:hypothetical protein
MRTPRKRSDSGAQEFIRQSLSALWHAGVRTNCDAPDLSGRIIFALDCLSSRDQQRLTDLVRQHGAELIIAATHEVLKLLAQPARKRGRPKQSLSLLRYKKMQDAAWIEERIAEHRRAGNRSPVKRAYLDFIDTNYAGKKQRIDVLLRTVKKLHHTGRRYLREEPQHTRLLRQVWVAAGRK